MREKYPNTEFFSGQYFPVIEMNTGKYGPEKTLYLDTFHACYQKTLSKKSQGIPVIVRQWNALEIHNSIHLKK